MNERHLTLAFCASISSVTQDILITDESYSADDIVQLLTEGNATTTLQQGGEVVHCGEVGSSHVIGTVVSSEFDAEYAEFEALGDGEYGVANSLQPFNATRLARSFAFGEVFSDTDNVATENIAGILTAAGNNPPILLDVAEAYKGQSGNQLLREIELLERGYMNAMTIAHAAGKRGQEII